MCMKNTVREKLNVKYAWKLLEYDRYRALWQTPIHGARINNNQLIATGRCLGRNKKITEGAIHCYRTKMDAENSWILRGFECIYAIFKVEGIGEIAHNGKEVAFKHIKFVDTVDDWEI